MWLFIGIIMFFIFIFWFLVLLPQSPAFKNKKENKSLSELKGQLQEGIMNFKEIQKQISDLREQTTEKNSQDTSNKTEKSSPRLPLENSD